MRTDETSIRSARDRRGSVKSYSDTGRYQPFWSRLCGRVSEKTRFTSLKDPDTWINMVKRPIECIPAVILGLLLNLLDAISYGMITFPLNNPIFAAFGPDGISMFFVSCIVAQLVYSGGGSCFEGGNGSAEQIIQSIGEDEPGRIVSSTVVAFAISSMMTGLAFFLLGALKLGSLIGFFPRHILVGTIGGVGWFLVATGIEVSARLTENLAYNLPMLRKLFLDTHTFALWSSSLGVAILLRIIQHRVSSPLVVPAFFMILPFAFYFVCVIFGLDIGHVRDAGWIFPLVESDLPFWHFYTYYDLTLVDWSAILKTLPAMLALTFFGLLHVPINVPALGVSTNKDDVDVNRELVAHGLSNAISGCLGAVQNYLVYTNSLLFIRSGGDSRLAGFMLAGATAIVWMIGPWIVGYIPVMVVGSLIFHLGLDLLKEALIDTWHSVHYLEYITICAIIACMSILGFVEGILVGIIMACIFFVVQKARRSQAIRASLSGRFMRSTVRRVYRQQRFLHYVSNQIQVIKLQGYLFFGTINQVERAIRDMLDERVWDVTPVRFVILDMQLVQGLDFSAAEAFVRIRRLLGSRDVYMIICNVARQSDEEKALAKSGMWMDEDNSQQTDLKCFQYLNDALEWCENVLLESYFAKMSQRQEVTQTDSLPSVASPRQKMLTKAVKDILEESQAPVIHSNMTQPMMILVQTYSELSSETVPVEFYHKLATYFERMTLRRGQVLYREGDPCDYMLVLEQGCLRSLMRVNHQDVTVESILPGSIVGELGLFTGSDGRTRSMVAEQDSVLWKLTKASLDKMLTEEPHMANKFILLSLHFSSDHLDTMTRYAFQLH
ncbi:sulfate transporter family-domain-containing protein [Radiomyces spectabilis]|uniref:sulfate transporter family-domain-containing protein n=1 Tax=Radiomyces spectabilis TaxID=64574 RepID=UPI00221FBF4B|nr:sulfate transporter family-domain-containing protein [Radiomyces spectabilis]KAI8369316.1 sulfate transporter family-domain-containing protein [Radiomyces spectabilis]